jgi:O-antigen/teichoic acid export membrane protein
MRRMGETGSIAAPAMRGSIWTMAGYTAGQALRLGSNIVLTRLLFPEVFGQMALVTIFLQGLQMFSDVGIGPAVVQNPRGEDPSFLRTAWTIQAGRGLVLWLGACLISVPVSKLYGQPLLAWLIPAAGFAAVLSGFESTSMHTLQRHLRLERLTLVELAGQAVSVVASVLLAVADRSLYGPNHPGAVWAVVWGGLAGSATRLALSHLALPGIRHRFRLEPEAMRTLFHFGRWIFVSTILTFLAGQSDRLVFGKLIPLDLFGVYGIAALLAALPTQAVLKLGGSVAFPAYSRLAAGEGLGGAFGRVRLPLLLGGATLVSGLIGCGPLLVGILYDRRYAAAGWILQFLSAMAWFQILESTTGAALLALGRVRWVAAGSAAKLAGMVVLIPLGFRLGGFPGALAGLVLSEVVKYLTAATGARLQGLRGFGGDALITMAIAASASAALVAGESLAADAHGRIASIAGAAAVVCAAWAGIGAWVLSRHRAERARSAGAKAPAAPVSPAGSDG